MSKVRKVLIFFDDGSFVEYDAQRPVETPAPAPVVPVVPTIDPYPYFKASHCPKCGLKMEGTMGYVCNQYPCPAGFGGVWSMCGND